MDYTMIYGVVLKRAGKVIRTLLYRLSYFNRINAIDLLRSSIFAEDFVGEAQYSGECINNVFWPGRARESMKKTHDNDKGSRSYHNPDHYQQGCIEPVFDNPCF
jgi:hypothetical protein